MSLRRRRPGLVYPVNEDWHYVGEAGEPAFQNSWENYGATMCLAFRMRETGLIDIHGTVTGGTSGSTIFTLPADYRPSASALYASVGLESGSGEFLAMTVNVASSGNVSLSHRSSSPPDRFFIAGQFFLNPANAP